MATKTWVGGTTNWDTPSNWSPMGAPASTDAIIFTGSSGRNKPCAKSTAFQPSYASISIEGGYNNTLTISGFQTLNVGVVNVGVVSSGSMLITTPNTSMLSISSTLSIASGNNLDVIGIRITSIAGLSTIDGTFKPTEVIFDGDITGSGILDLSAVTGMGGYGGAYIWGSVLSVLGEIKAPPEASGNSFMMHGAEWRTPATYTHNNGSIYFGISTTLANDSEQFHDIIIGGILDTSAVNSWYLAASGKITINNSATLNLNDSGTVSAAEWYQYATGTINAGTTTIKSTGPITLLVTYNHVTATIQLTTAATIAMLVADGTEIYNLTIDAGTEATADHTINVGGSITGTITDDQAGATTFTVLNALTITGTLHAKNGTMPGGGTMPINNNACKVIMLTIGG
jgi:hypothetical protein